MSKKIIKNKILLLMSLCLLYFAYTMSIFGPMAIIASIYSADQFNPDPTAAYVARFLIRTNIQEIFIGILVFFGILGTIFSFNFKRK
ncbi:hypothetical protein JZU46_06355 [bacterium]|nr:hypothetical protein [bacterium]